mmetsp:Transcript_11262/g.33832  ORF Transcript_11262/g.33832 Transcript_11262/m.33832 type:complete len:752 (-) Transcript_11262:379-2634(-)|eukprot:CAMPEP_0206144802 /NCGR_PEP_ID=MMETSP1473-20131121/25401_1 /ASSEMBLY_ACC=CAM_ASM_001109 /TAXON_ID=1461547 /ORGANISM="Stichococcus sp, Strain RCC1054" /LENGTH=751 /DNA_ID=CAMNT_0053540763 /DNA_START=475 /DNA_END=2730 /DNA_ORIENTATION=-
MNPKHWLLLLLAGNAAVLLYQARWYLPPVDLDGDIEFSGGEGRHGLSHRGHASTFFQGSGLWRRARRRKHHDFSAFSAAEAGAAGAFNAGVDQDFDAVQHLRDVFQSRANLTALKEAQHSALTVTSDASTAEQSGAQAASVAASMGAHAQHSRYSAAGGALGSSSGRGGSGRTGELHSKSSSLSTAIRRAGSSGRGDGGLGLDGGHGKGGGGSLSAEGATQRVASPLYSDPIAGDGSAFSMPDPAIILFCYNRSDYLERTLKSLSSLEGLDQFALYISQDGRNSKVEAVVKQWRKRLGSAARKFEHWQHPRKPPPGYPAQQPGHAWLAQHYRWGLERVFDRTRAHSHVVVLEDDMEFSPDFLLFFRATAVLLEVDPTLWCISSWNDNSRAAHFRWSARRMLRTSYFPGLGWMMRAELWREIGAWWPDQQWDHWMRVSPVSKDRDCVAPEVNRNRNFGERGANMNRIYHRAYLHYMTWHEDTVRDFGDLSYLVKGNYERGMRTLVDRARLRPLPRAGPLPDNVLRGAASRREGNGKFDDVTVSSEDVHRALEAPAGHIYLMVYRVEDYPTIARHLRIFPYPRAHFHNIALLPYQGSFFLLADGRMCPLLPDAHRIPPTPGLLPVPAQAFQSCDSACRAQGKECGGQDFWFINTCQALADAFPCQAGCGLELGPEVPCYVDDARLNTHQKCLVTQRKPRCSARHASTKRLCPCIPPDSDAGGADESGKTLTGGQAAAVGSDARKHKDFAWLTN